MSYFYLFILLFITVYIALTNKHSYFKFNKNIVIAALIAAASLMLYESFLSEGSLPSNGSDICGFVGSKATLDIS